MRKKFPGCGACLSLGSSCASTADTRPISACESLISPVSDLLRWRPADQRGFFKFLQYKCCAGPYPEARLHLGGVMTTPVKGLPEGASVVIPRLFCRDVASEIDFCVNTLGAVERVRRPGPNSSVAHALLTIGPAMIMIEAEWPGVPTRAPQ